MRHSPAVKWKDILKVDGDLTAMPSTLVDVAFGSCRRLVTCEI